MKNLISYFLMLCALMGVTASCTDALENMDETVTATKGFTIYATTEDAQNQTRLGLADDGMTMLWEYGDKLVLVNKETGDSIQMPANLVEGAAPAASASFTTEEGVAPGEYWVLCNIDSKSLTCTSQPLYTKEEIKAKKLLKLYASLTVEQDQKTAEIVLKNVYAKVRINLQNAEQLTSNQSLLIGMMNPNGVSVQQRLSCQEDVIGLENTTFLFQHEFSGSSIKYAANQLRLQQTDLYSLVLPQDFRDKNIYFYVAYVSDKIWEFKKSGILLEAGKSYVINLDLNNPTEEHAFKFSEIETASDLRFARYSESYYSGNKYNLLNDIDLEGVDVFPLSKYSINANFSLVTLEGNGHTIKNLKIQAPNVDRVSLFGSATNLTIENATIEGKDYVSSMAQSPSTNSTNCHLKGTCTIKGYNNVGGLFANDSGSVGQISNCSVEGDVQVVGNNYVGGILGTGFASYNTTTGNMSFLLVGDRVQVQGVENVGGIAGFSSHNISYANSAARVSGQTYVGGITGAGGKSYIRCGNTGAITGQSYVGGISGESRNSCKVLSNCYNTGTISGLSYLGGLIGHNISTNSLEIKLSYNSGTLKATESGEYVGGLVGKSQGTSTSNMVNISNCYSIGSIKGGSSKVAGLVGDAFYTTISNSYSSTSDSSDSFPGICSYSGTTSNAKYITITNCVTSCYSTGYDDVTGIVESNVYTGINDIQKKLDVLNSGDSKYYSESTTQMWPVANYPAKCPVFVWQTDPLNGDNIFAPGFSQETEW